MRLRNKIIITIVMLAMMAILNNNVFASSTNSTDEINSSTMIQTSSSMKLEIPIVKQKKEIDLNEIIEKNEKEVITERIEKNEIDVEFSTHYRENNSLAKGKIQTLQEGQDGKQNAIMKASIKKEN